jgi:hypothetical protein
MDSKTRGAACARVALLPGIAALVLSTGSGCGYRVVGYESDSQPSLGVSIHTFRNDSLEPGVEQMVGEALRREFLRAGRLRLVEDVGAADYRISGAVAPLETSTRSFSPGVRAVEFTVAMRLRLKVEGKDGTRLALDAFSLRASEIYLASADIEVSRKNRSEALRRIAALLAERVYDEMELRIPSSAGGRDAS